MPSYSPAPGERLRVGTTPIAGMRDAEVEDASSWRTQSRRASARARYTHMAQFVQTLHTCTRAGRKQWPSDTMVATGRKARSAKNRLSLSRVAVPVSLTGLQLPPGCAVSAKDIDELVHGESALQQLCALKNIGTQRTRGARDAHRVAVRLR